MLVSKIFKKQYSPAKKWSIRSRSKKKYILIKNIRNLLKQLSGNDNVNMLMEILTNQEISNYHLNMLMHLKE